MSHHCHANDCQVATDPKLLMCLKHWRYVPKAMQSKVWFTFRQRKGTPSTHPASWASYYEACAEAVEYVAKIEGKDTKNSYRDMLPLLNNIEVK